MQNIKDGKDIRDIDKMLLNTTIKGLDNYKGGSCYPDQGAVNLTREL